MPLQVRDGSNYFPENHEWPHIVGINGGGISRFPFMSFGYDYKRTIEELRDISLPLHIQVWDALSDASKILWDPFTGPSYGKPGRAYYSDYSGLVSKPCLMPYDGGGDRNDQSHGNFLPSFLSNHHPGPGAKSLNLGQGSLEKEFPLKMQRFSQKTLEVQLSIKPIYSSKGFGLGLFWLTLLFKLGSDSCSENFLLGEAHLRLKT